MPERARRNRWDGGQRHPRSRFGPFGGPRLPYPPEPEHAADLAEEFAKTVQELEQVQLDWSVDSLQWVDGLLDSFGEPGSDRTAETVLMAGRYVGETLVRNHSYTWGVPPPAVADGMFPLVVIAPDGVANPIGKAFKLVENGPEDSVHFFAAAEAAGYELRRAGN